MVGTFAVASSVKLYGGLVNVPVRVILFTPPPKSLPDWLTKPSTGLSPVVSIGVPKLRNTLFWTSIWAFSREWTPVLPLVNVLLKTCPVPKRRLGVRLSKFVNELWGEGTRRGGG